MKTKILSLLSIIFILSISGFGSEPALWEQKLNAQIDYQKKVADMLLKEAPELEEIIVFSSDLQITMYEMKREKYLYLIKNYPGRIDPDKDLNFDWNDEDENKLAQINKNYASLKKKKEKLMIKNQGHPLLPDLREKFKSLRETEEYRKIYKGLLKIILR